MASASALLDRPLVQPVSPNDSEDVVLQVQREGAEEPCYICVSRVFLKVILSMACMGAVGAGAGALLGYVGGSSWWTGLLSRLPINQSVTQDLTFLSMKTCIEVGGLAGAYFGLLFRSRRAGACDSNISLTRFVINLF